MTNIGRSPVSDRIVSHVIFHDDSVGIVNGNAPLIVVVDGTVLNVDAIPHSVLENVKVDWISAQNIFLAHLSEFHVGNMNLIGLTYDHVPTKEGVRVGTVISTNDNVPERIRLEMVEYLASSEVRPQPAEAILPSVCTEVLSSE